MHVEEVHGIEGFLQLETVWDDLCRESLRQSFFVSHAWFRCCLAGLPPDTRPLVLLIRDGSAVTGIVPLLSHRDTWRIFPARWLSLMQNQDSPFADIVLSPTHATQVVAAVLEHLHRRAGWYVWSAPKIDRGSPTASLLAEHLSHRPHLRVLAGRSPRLNVDGDWSVFWTAQSQRFKKTVRNVANRVERLGNVEIVDQAASESPTDCMGVFRAVAAKSWKAGLPVSVTHNPRIAAFFQALTTTLHVRGQLALWVLCLDGVPIATEYHVQDGDTVYALRGDFDKRYGGVSPGAHLNAFIVRAYFERDVRVYDMGPGDSEYKRRWATTAREYETFSLFKPTPYALALYAMEHHAVPRLRRARNWWRKRSAWQYASAYA